MKTRRRFSIVAIRNPWIRVPLAIGSAPVALILCVVAGIVRGLDEAGSLIYHTARGERIQ